MFTKYLQMHMSYTVFGFVIFSNSFFLNFFLTIVYLGFPGGSVVKNPPASTEDAGSIPGWGRSPGEGSAAHSSVLAREIP